MPDQTDIGPHSLLQGHFERTSRRHTADAIWSHAIISRRVN